jgi:hypothetical protein
MAEQNLAGGQALIRAPPDGGLAEETSFPYCTCR